MAFQGEEEIGGFDTLDRGPGDDHDIQPSQLSLMGAEALADKAFDSISRNGAAYAPLGYGEAKTRHTKAIPPTQNHNNRVY